MFIARDGSIFQTLITFNKNITLTKKFEIFTYSREAIFTILKENNISAFDEIILPSYLCSTVIESILPFTEHLLFYSIHEDMTFDDQEILALVSEKTKLIFFVDYFGVETHISKELELFLKAKNILIVKDAAHSFLSLLNNRFLQHYEYDYLISSIYKNIPLQVGALAIGKFQVDHNFINLTIFIKRIIILFIKNCLSFLKQTQYINRNIKEIMTSNDHYKDYSYGINMSRLYLFILKHLNFSKIITKKQTLAERYYDIFFTNGIYSSLFSKTVIQKNVLQAYPIKCSNQEKRDLLLTILQDEAIDAYTWPTFHKMNCNDALWSKILLLPLDNKVLQVLQKTLPKLRNQ